MKRCVALTSGLLLALPSALCLPQDTEGQREMRAAWYAFGMGYTAALIAQAPPLPDEGRRQANTSAGTVTWLAITGGKPVPLSLRVSRLGTVGYDITIGTTTAADIRRQWGPPAAEKAGRLTYRGEAEICSDSYDFVFKSGVLREVSWAWCSD